MAFACVNRKFIEDTPRIEYIDDKTVWKVLNMGAFAGSAALKCRNPVDRVNVVTLTINNVCNLKCPHCYLQYDGADKPLDPSACNAIWQSEARTLSIVGMEPLANKASADRLAEIVEEAKARGFEVGFITNGLNAHLLRPQTAEFIDWIDVSVDGVAESYAGFRGGKFEKLQSGLKAFRSAGVKEINLLQTVNSTNIHLMPGMADLRKELAADKVVFSPFCSTRSHGIQDQLSISSGEFLKACLHAKPHLRDAWVVMDAEWLGSEGAVEGYKTALAGLFQDRIVFFENDPIFYGMTRVTYEGELLTPRQAMHTQDYGQLSMSAREHSLEEFRRFATQNSASTSHLKAA